MALFEQTLVLLLAAVLLAGVARKIGAPYPPLIAMAGAALAFLPLGPPIRIDPQLALALFVAPVLLDAAFDTSPRDLRRHWISLTSLVVVAVALTTAAVAFVGWRWGGLPIAAAIALGAIVAPPDAASAASILGQLRPPQRILQVLTGESLLNDAVALLIYRLAVIAAVGGVTLADAGPLLLLAGVGSPVAGYILARVYLRFTRGVNDAASAVVFQFVSVFGVWLLAEAMQLSAIVTMVVYAITLSQSPASGQSARLRISSYSVWETVVFVLNVLAFVLMGLQARPILEHLRGGERWHALAIAGVVLVTVMGVRMAYVLGWHSLVRLRLKLRGADKTTDTLAPTPKSALLVAWCGMRGLVTLAAAFALPDRFPGRDLIVLCAFVVVLGTLVIQGFTLKPLMVALKLQPDNVVDEDVSRARTEAVDAAVAMLRLVGTPAAELMVRELGAVRKVADDAEAPQGATEHDNLRLKAIAVQRQAIQRLRHEGEIGDEAYHRLQEEYDWAELSASPAGAFQPLTT